MSEYPEHDKLSAVKEESQTIGLFLDWLQGQGVELVVWEEREMSVPCSEYFCEDGVLTGRYGGRTRGDDCPTCDGTGWVMGRRENYYPWEPRGIQERLALYYDIDYKKLMAEKDAMLDAFRAKANS